MAAKIATVLAASVIMPIVNRRAANAAVAAWNGVMDWEYYWTFCFGLTVGSVMIFTDCTMPGATAFGPRQEV